MQVPLWELTRSHKMHEGEVCPESTLYIFSKAKSEQWYYKSYFWSGISFCSPTNAEDSHLSIQQVWYLHCKPQIQSSCFLFADGLVLLFVPYSARYPSSKYSTFNIFHTVTAQHFEQLLKLISIQNKAARTILRDNFHGK